jgi:general stress protein 26
MFDVRFFEDRRMPKNRVKLFDEAIGRVDMNKRDVLREIEKIIEDVKTAVLSTVDEGGNPTMRWVTPVILRGRTGALYIVTSPGSNKVHHVRKNPNVQWMLQTRSLGTIINVFGKVNILDNPSIRNEVLEVVGPRLHAFWKITGDERDLLVLETVVRKVVYYISMKGVKEEFLFE